MTTVDKILPVEKNGLCIRQVGDVWGNKKWYLKITLNIKFLWQLKDLTFTSPISHKEKRWKKATRSHLAPCWMIA